jgi:hypothetical protein
MDGVIVLRQSMTSLSPIRAAIFIIIDKRRDDDIFVRVVHTRVAIVLNSHVLLRQVDVVQLERLEIRWRCVAGYDVDGTLFLSTAGWVVFCPV